MQKFMHFERPEKTIDFPAIEKTILAKWEKEDTFQRSINERPVEKKYNFYDGPPFATGMPHFGHFVPSSLKDAFARYFTMKGYRVERRFGWDCHGVPVELLVQKELGIEGKQTIEEFGIAKFNDACRASVGRYAGEWRNYMNRLGRWVDMDNDFRTMDPSFMESVWYAFKTLWDKNLVYEGKFVVSYSIALRSTLSNFEASLDYRDIQDPSLTVQAKLKGDVHGGKSLLVWTTTPWTLPANLAIAVDPTGVYCEAEEPTSGQRLYILKERLSDYSPKETPYKVIREFLGKELEGVSYEPFFPSFVSIGGKNAFKIYSGSFVLHDTGTGAVHMAPAFGEDDFKLCKEAGIPILDHLDAGGNFTSDNIPELVGLNFKQGDKVAIAYLKKHGFVFKHDTLVHSYPHCYRSGVPLMYRAMPSWFVKVEENKELFLKINEQINWIPDHIKHGRFGKWLQNAKDWNIGRSRYWGNPIPIWKNETTGECLCLGSIAELQKYTSKKITDLHMEFIDDIEIPSQKHPGTMLRRVPFVLDCWFESGSMPYAQQHYPFERKDEFPTLFPADFICEGLDQTRGWFYTLVLLSSLLFGKPPFKNVVVNGLVLAEDGRKMSKSLKNYPDPMLTLEEYGADSVRLFLLSSPVTVAEEARFSLEGVKESTRRILLPLWNAYAFFATYAAIDQWNPQEHTVVSKQPMDKWILLKLNELIKIVDENIQSYQIAKVSPSLSGFLDDLNNWYIRRNRRRFWNNDKEAYSTLYEVLLKFTQILSPFAPFSTEYFFEKLARTDDLRNLGSVHLSLLPNFRSLTKAEEELLEETATAKKIVELGRHIRVVHKIKNKQPLSQVTIGVLTDQMEQQIFKVRDIIASELNVKEVLVTKNPGQLANIFIKPNFKTLGKKMGNQIKELQSALNEISQELSLKALLKQDIQVGAHLLTPEDILVELRPNGNQLVASSADLVVALDPTITEELKMEGLARELVSLIQKSRKSADFNVEDRILLRIVASQKLSDAIVKNQDYLEEETLAQIVEKLESIHFSEQVVCEGETLTLELMKRES